MKSQDQIEDNRKSRRVARSIGIFAFSEKFAISNDKNIIKNYEEGNTNFIVNTCLWRFCGS